MFVFDKILIHSLCGVSSADSQWLIVSLVPRLRSVIFVVVSACMPRSLKLYRHKQFNVFEVFWLHRSDPHSRVSPRCGGERESSFSEFPWLDYLLSHLKRSRHPSSVAGIMSVARNCDGEEGVMGCLHFWQLLFRYFSSAYQVVYSER